ncbi:GGDEF domain-containing protein [Sulfurimonas sp.]|uniref:GGDEF domain-containing protein n=1 Tax=Sulfurimonas sp. TaxID=2022749 RepID=UPI00356135D7
MKKYNLTNLLLANIDVKTYEPIYRKMVLLYIILLATIVGFGLFSVLNMFVLNNYFVSILNFISFLIVAYAFYHLRKTGTIELVSNIVTANIFIFLLLLVYFQEGKDFTFIWTIFLPITAILLNGSKKGTLYSAVFYLIFFSMAYSGINVWQDGHWTSVSFIRLIFASLILVYVLYLIEQSFEKSYIALEETRSKEKEYLEQLHQISITDHLTGLYNRRELNSIFQSTFEMAKSSEKYFAFFILDLDYFKEYNDNYGHHKGDQVLIEIGAVLKKNLRRGIDNVFRLGGEEFSGFLVSDSEENIFNYIEKIRKDIEELKIVHAKNPHKFVTASFGVSVIKKYNIIDFDFIYKVADEFLYEAKDAGRNTIKGSIVDFSCEI